MDPDDPCAIAETELLGAASSIDAAAKKLAGLRPRRQVKVRRSPCPHLGLGNGRGLKCPTTRKYCYERFWKNLLANIALCHDYECSYAEDWVGEMVSILV